jgi:hypothetical protein
MRKFFGPMGTIHRFFVESEALKGNILGDPTARAVDVYVSAGHDGHGLPLLVDLVGTTSSGLSHTNWTAFQENMPERLDRLIGEHLMPPVMVAFPDCFTRVGGNQYVNSAATGAWEDFLIDEMLPVIERRFGCGGAARRVREKLWRLRSHHPCPAPPGRLGGRSVPFRRYGIRVVLSA